MGNEELDTVATYQLRHEAEIARAALQSAGIDAMVFADNEGGLNPGFFADYGVRLVVRTSDLGDARKLLADVGREEPMGRSVEVQAEQLEAMVAHATFCLPNEACGLVAAEPGGALTMVYCLTNVDASPYRFTVDPTEHFRAWRHAERHGWDLAGSFHSHPASPAVPSQTDIAGALDPSWVYFVVSLALAAGPDVRAYRIDDGGVSERAIRVPDP